MEITERNPLIPIEGSTQEMRERAQRLTECLRMASEKAGKPGHRNFYGEIDHIARRREEKRRFKDEIKKEFGRNHGIALWDSEYAIFHPDEYQGLIMPFCADERTFYVCSSPASGRWFNAYPRADWNEYEAMTHALLGERTIQAACANLAPKSFRVEYSPKTSEIFLYGWGSKAQMELAWEQLPDGFNSYNAKGRKYCARKAGSEQWKQSDSFSMHDRLEAMFKDSDLCFIKDGEWEYCRAIGVTEHAYRAR